MVEFLFSEPREPGDDIGLLGRGAVPAEHGIAVPAELDRSLLGPLLTDYLREFPDVRLVSVLVNEQFDLLTGGFDLAIIVRSILRPSYQRDRTID